MGKDSEGYSNTTSSVSSSTTIYDIHIATLQVIENQLGRLHRSLSAGDGDEDVTQEQISQLQAELVRLSEKLGEAEIGTSLSGSPG